MKTIHVEGIRPADGNDIESIEITWSDESANDSDVVIDQNNNERDLKSKEPAEYLCPQKADPTPKAACQNEVVVEGDRLISIKEVGKKVDACKSTIYNWMDESSPYFRTDFPRPIRLSVRRIAWRLSDIDAFLLQLD